MKDVTFIIIPTYNERENLQRLVTRLMRLPPRIGVIIVDDNSPDGTGVLADALEKHYQRVSVIHRPHKRGLGSAYQVGFRKALKNGAGIIMTMDADFFHDPRYIPQFLEKIKTVDVVIGSRHMDGGKTLGFSLWRTALSTGAQILCRFLLGLPVWDSTSGFRAYRREVLQAIRPHTIKSQGYSFLIEALYRVKEQGFRIAEVPIVAPARTRGTSKISELEIIKALGTVVRLLMQPGKRP